MVDLSLGDHEPSDLDRVTDGRGHDISVVSDIERIKMVGATISLEFYGRLVQWKNITFTP